METNKQKNPNSIRNKSQQIQEEIIVLSQEFPSGIYLAWLTIHKLKLFQLISTLQSDSVY